MTSSPPCTRAATVAARRPLVIGAGEIAARGVPGQRPRLGGHRRLCSCPSRRATPLAETHDPEAHDDAYGRAINRPYGPAWRRRSPSAGKPDTETKRPQPNCPIPRLGLGGARLSRRRAPLGPRRHRPVLEYAAEDWLARRHALLFGGALGVVTFEATVKYAGPTRWLFENCRSQLADAALRGVPNAVSLRLIGYLWDIDRYTIPSILGGARGQDAVLRAIAEEMPSLIQHVESDDPLLARALAFWDGMLDGPGSNIPAAPLAATGRWVYVKAVSTEDLVERFDRTTALTGGEMDYATEIAERCRDEQPNETALRVLLRMQGHGQPWERDHVGHVAVEALARASGKGPSDEFNRLRLRLIDLGFHSVPTSAQNRRLAVRAPLTSRARSAPSLALIAERRTRAGYVDGDVASRARMDCRRRAAARRARRRLRSRSAGPGGCTPSPCPASS